MSLTSKFIILMVNFDEEFASQNLSSVKRVPRQFNSEKRTFGVIYHRVIIGGIFLLGLAWELFVKSVTKMTISVILAKYEPDARTT